MNQPSAFQLQYPLSPRKFWKKMLGVLGTTGIRLLILIGAIIFINVRLSDVISSGDTGGSSIFSYILWLLVGIFIVWNIIYAIYIKAYIKRYYYDCGDQFITIKKGVFAPTEIHVQYQKIQDVYVDQDIFDRMLGLYDVHIASATVTSGIEAHIDGVDQTTGESIKNYLLAKIKGENISMNKNQPTSQTQSSPQFQSNEKISTQSYPISGSWMVVATVNAFISSLVLTLIMSAFLSQVLTTWVSNSFMLWFGIFVVLFILLVIRAVIWKSNYYFEFMPDYILLRTGVLGRKENHLPYKSIQNVINKQSITERILGLSTVKIENAVADGVGVTIVGQPTTKAEQLNDVLNKIVSTVKGSSSMGV